MDRPQPVQIDAAIRQQEVVMRKQMLIVVLLTASCLFAQDLKPIVLPPPQTGGGRPLMQVFRERKTTREFAPDKLPPQVLSNLLWAAFGVNRPDGRRTAPSAMNWQEIEVYVATSEGLFLYDAKENRLQTVLAGDIRQATGTQSFVANAPLNLVYVADLSKSGTGPETELFTAADAGFISQNVYLSCASENLATVVRGSIDRAALAKVMKLRSRTEDHSGPNSWLSKEVAGGPKFHWSNKGRAVRGLCG